MWDWALLIALCLTLLAVNGLGVVLTALQLPGTWLMVGATAALAWFYWEPVPGVAGVPAERLIGWWGLAVLLGLALLGEVLEFIAGAAGSKVAGGSKRGAMISIGTAILGAIIGTPLIPIPIVGTLVGAAIGAAVGSVLGDMWAGRTRPQYVRAAGGAFVGKLTGAAMKLGVAAAMWLWVAGTLLI